MRVCLAHLRNGKEARVTRGAWTRGQGVGDKVREVPRGLDHIGTVGSEHFKLLNWQTGEVICGFWAEEWKCKTNILKRSITLAALLRIDCKAEREEAERLFNNLDVTEGWGGPEWLQWKWWEGVRFWIYFEDGLNNKMSEKETCSKIDS